jgi:hypothetical protein
MTISIAPVVEATDSFGQWLAKTNLVINAISNSTVTVNSNTSVGNAAITGTFSAHSYVTANSGSLFIGTNTANATVNAAAILIRSTSTSNNIITSSGMLIDGTTAYTKTLISLNNTVITTANVNSNAAYFSDRVIVGNSYIYNNSMVINTANILNAAFGTSLYVGAQDGNTYISRNGIYIVYNDNLPGGDSNSYLTATELKVGKVSTSNLNLIGTASKFFSNVEFNGANNYFARGLVAASNTQTGNLVIYSPYNITPDANWTSQLKIVGSGYSGGISLDADGMWVGHNSSSRKLIFATNDTNRLFVNNSHTIVTTKMHVGSATQHGIYTATANDSLEVDGTLRLKSSANTGWFRIIPPNTVNQFSMRFEDAGGEIGDVLQILQAPSANDVVVGFSKSAGNVKLDNTLRSLGVGTGASGTTGEIRATNNIIAYFTSDKKLKENITPIVNALQKLNQINGVEFDWNKDFIEQSGGEDGYFVRKHDVGVIAQEIETVLPEAVATRSDGTKAVNYEKIVPLLIEAIKELKVEVDRLKNGN